MRILPGWWQRRFLAYEGAFALVVSVVFGFWYIEMGGGPCVDHLLQSYRQAIYSTASSVIGSLLGFIITAASIVMAVSSSDRLRLIRESRQYPTLWAVFRSTIRAAGFATAATFLALIFDRDQRPVWWLVIVVFFGVLLASLRIARAIWALENVMGLVATPRPEDHNT
jgi:hypothetical protein